MRRAQLPYCFGREATTGVRHQAQRREWLRAKRLHLEQLKPERRYSGQHRDVLGEKRADQTPRHR